MSKLYDLLNSIISKLKATEKSMPKKISDLEQDIPQVQPDWNQTDSSKLDHIKNKPTTEDTESIVMDTLVALDIAPVIQDADGSVLADGDGAILVNPNTLDDAETESF